MIEAFLINAGPTGTGLDPPKPVPLPVGGEVLPAEIFSVLPKYVLLALILLLPIILVFGKKRDVIMDFMSKFW
jgi:hypothetical protein